MYKYLVSLIFTILSIKPLFSMVDGLVPILPTWTAPGDPGETLGTLHYRQINKSGPSAGLLGDRGLGEVGDTSSADAADLPTVLGLPEAA